MDFVLFVEEEKMNYQKIVFKILVAMVSSTLENNVMMEIPEAETGALIV